MALAAHLSAAVALADQFPVLAGVDLDVVEGEVVVVQGPNGAGKTSLLRLCCGLLPLTSGEAEVLGVDLGRDRVGLRRKVALLGHASFLYDDLTAAENVAFALRCARLARSGTAGALEAFELTGRVQRTPVGRLSAGQRRRVALASLVARAAPLWLLDEPHAGLDAHARDLLDSAVRNAAAAGTTVILASHDAERSLALADRVVTMAGGCVVASGSSPAPRALDANGVGRTEGAGVGRTEGAGTDGRMAGERTLAEVPHVA